MRIINLLNQPFPVNSWRWYKIRGWGFGLFVFLFLFLFKPFRLDLYSTPRLFFTATLYGLVTSTVMFLGGFFFTKVITPNINEEKWTVGKQISLNLLLMMCITVFNVLVTQLVHQVILPLWWHFYMLKWVLMLGVLPVVVAELLSYNYYLRQHVKAADGLSIKALIPDRTTALHPKRNERTDSVKQHFFPKPLGKAVSIVEPNTTPVLAGEVKLLKLVGDNQNDSLEIPDYRLLAVQALDNYVNIFWELDNKLQTTLLRNTLTRIGEQLSSTHFVYRCHRGWLVNIQKVKQVGGNAQGLKLTIDLLQQPVPVSRANIEGYRKITGIGCN